MRSAQAQSEDLIMDVVALLTSLLKEEGLGESEGRIRVAVNHEAARHEYKDAVVDGGLIVSHSVC